MNVSSLLTESKSHQDHQQAQASAHQATERYQSADMSIDNVMSGRSLEQLPNTTIISSQDSSGPVLRSRGEPFTDRPPKQVTFELLMDGNHQRARLPMRVKVSPRDTTDHIVVTVKHFYGLYDSNYTGVSFEDKKGNTLIATYDNFDDQMIVYVRAFEDTNAANSVVGYARHSLSPRRPRLAPPFELPHAQVQDVNISRPSSRTARNRSTSPHNSRGQRSQSASTNPKSRSKLNPKGRTGSVQSSFADTHADVDMSDSDGGNASVTSSRRGKIDVVASAEISVENIVEGGRRKRARFDSSELPLFQPGQMATSISSLSPQRRLGSQPVASPYQYSNHQNITWSNALPSPQSYSGTGISSVPGPYMNKSQQRGHGQYTMNRPSSYGVNQGVLPTPDPTIGSVISDEDVARQLMALGDPSNFSHYTGRTSTSTVDDAYSGKADLASSAECSEGSDVEDGLPEAAVYTSSDEDCEDSNDASFKGESDGILPEHMMQNAALAPGMTPHGQMAYPKPIKAAKPRPLNVAPKKLKPASGNKGAPLSPNSLPTHSRKPSNASIQQFTLPLAADEEDLSAKPRCQRCRKSKKGCDRQRPCGRCKDAGIGIEGCVSEDEGNGRKGRYGRHMGVIIKKAGTEMLPLAAAAGPAPMIQQQFPQPILGSMAAPNFLPDKNGKKRKR